MNIKEAVIQLRDDIKTWVTNNIRALAASKADVEHTHNIGGRNIALGTLIGWGLMGAEERYVTYDINADIFEIQTPYTVSAKIDNTKNVTQIKVGLTDSAYSYGTCYTELTLDVVDGRIEGTFDGIDEVPEMIVLTPVFEGEFIINFTQVKLEKGTMATDWTEAPEDIDERISRKANADHTHNELLRLPAPVISYWYDGEVDGPICRLDISSGENVTYEIYCGKDIDGYDGISYEYLALWDSSIDPGYFHDIDGYIVDQYETYSGKYSMYIIAKGDGENSFDSDRSNIITFTLSLPRMEAPVISLSTDGNYIQFVQSIGAGTYELWCADCDVSGNQTSDYRLVDTGSISAGTAFATLSELTDTKIAKFYVIAKGDGINYDDSPSSNIITWEK